MTPPAARFPFFDNRIVPIEDAKVSVMPHAFNYGTGVQISAIPRIEHRAIGGGVVGDITRRLRTLFFDVVAGKAARYREWLVLVYPARHGQWPVADVPEAVASRSIPAGRVENPRNTAGIAAVFALPSGRPIWLCALRTSATRH